MLNFPLVHGNARTNSSFFSNPKQLKIASIMVRQDDISATSIIGRLHFSPGMPNFPSIWANVLCSNPAAQHIHFRRQIGANRFPVTYARGDFGLFLEFTVGFVSATSVFESVIVSLINRVSTFNGQTISSRSNQPSKQASVFARRFCINISE